MDAHDIVLISNSAAIATDAEDRILSWNDAARELFGFEDSEAVGRTLDCVFGPRDVFGNPLRYEGALFFGLLEEGDSARNFECNLRGSDGEYRRYAVSVVMMLGQGPADNQLVHVLREVRQRRKADAFLARVLNGHGAGTSGFGASLRSEHSDPTVLTVRQREILLVMAEGKNTRQIADDLCISQETVRSHIRHIFDRLDAHSRVEAVSTAYQRHLI